MGEEDAQEGGDITTSEIIRIKQEVQSAEEEEEAPNDADEEEDEPTEPEKVEESPIIKIEQEKMDVAAAAVEAKTESPAKPKESPAKATKESPAKANESPAKAKLESPAKTKLASPAKAKTDSPAKKQKGFGHVQEGSVKVKMEPSDDVPRVKVEPAE